ncbi:hypothetical protein HDU97_004825 [Phlyctochytrium planicorne]|nr:hypothetical protein HDU97_004825 [Phlyctochytrium planicorne]
MDQEFENGIRILREAFSKKLSLRESEIVQLRGELARKEAEVKDLSHRVSQLESQVARGDKRIAEMSRAVSKLASFKQAVMDSLATDDGEASDLKRIQADVNIIDNDVVGRNQDTFIGDSTTRLSGRSSAQTYQSSPERQVDDILNSINAVKGLKHTPSSENIRRRSPTPNSNPQANAILSGVFNGSPINPLTSSPGGKKGAGVVSFSGIEGHDSNLIRNAGGGSLANSYTYGLGGPSGSQPVLFEHQGIHGDGLSQSAPQQTSNVQSVDGREFFRNARAVLSYDEFTSLLTNVKAYNAREQSKHRTLENLHGLLGDKHKQIFEQFERLLSR